MGQKIVDIIYKITEGSRSVMRITNRAADAASKISKVKVNLPHKPQVLLKKTYVPDDWEKTSVTGK